MKSDPAIRWLLRNGDPSVRYLTLTELLDRPLQAADVQAARRGIRRSARVRALLSGQRTDGGFGAHPYQKWTGAHWRLVSLVELGLPAEEPRAHAAAEQVLQWLTGPAHRSRIRRLNGRTRRCASQEGNALAVCSRKGARPMPRDAHLKRDSPHGRSARCRRSMAG